MKKIIKKINVFLMVICLVIADIPFNGLITVLTKAEEALEQDGYKYVVSDEGVSIVEYVGNEKDVVVPGQIEGVDVVTIRNNVFKGKGIESLTIPSSVTTASHIISYDESVKEVTFAEGMEKIPEGILDEAHGVEKVNIPYTVTTINEGAFKGATSLETINLPSNLKSIGSDAFKYCTSITSMDLPQGLETIGGYAFVGTGIESLTIPSSVTTAGHMLSYDESVKEVTFAEGMENIPKEILDEAHGVEKVNIPDSVKSIEESAFKGAISLETINLPSNLKSIGRYAFNWCTSITSLDLPEGLETIGGHAFVGTGIKSLTIPSSVTTASNILAYDETLKEVTFAGGRESIPKSILENAQGVETVNIPDTVKSIEGNAFKGTSSLDTIRIPSGVTRIEKSSFDEKVAFICENRNTYPYIYSYIRNKKTSYLKNYRESDSILADTGNSYQNVTSVNKDYYSMEIVYECNKEINDESEIIVLLGESYLMPNESVYVDGVLQENVEIDQYALYVPVTKKSGKIRFTCKVDTSVEERDTRSIALFSENKVKRDSLNVANYIDCEVIDVFENDNNVLTAIGNYNETKQTIEIQGYAPIASKLVFEVDDSQVATSSATAYGTYEVSFPSDCIQGKERIVVEITATEENENTCNTAVIVENINNDEKPIIKKFDFYYNQVYGETKIDLLNCNEKYYSYNLYKPFSFELEIENINTNNEVYIVGNNGHIEKEIKATYDENTGKYYARGWFGNDKNFVTKKIGVDIRKKVTSEEMNNYVMSEGYQEYFEIKYPNNEIVKNEDNEVKEVSFYRNGKEKQVVPDVSVKYIESQNVDKDDCMDMIYKLGLDGTEECVSSIEEKDGDLYCVIKGSPVSGTNFAFSFQMNGNSSSMRPGTGYNYTSLASSMNGIFGSSDSELILNAASGGLLSMDDLEFMDKHGTDSNATFAYAAIRALNEAAMDLVNDWFDELTEGVWSLWNYAKDMCGIVDPSGFAYEAVESNRLSGVTATLYYRQDETSEAILWDAEEYGQINPQITSEDGAYAWDVPEGEWQVRLTKEGYENAQSEWLPVPPPQLGINISMVSKEAPIVQEYYASEEKIKIKFSKYVKVSTLTEDSIVVKDENGNNISLQISPEGEEEFTNVVNLSGDLSQYGGQVLTVELLDSIQSYADVAIKEDVLSVKVHKNTYIDVNKQKFIMIPGEEREVIVNVIGDNFNGKRIKCESEAGLSINVPDYVEIENDRAIVTIKADRYADSNIVFTLEDTDIKTSVEVNVIQNKANPELKCTTNLSKEYDGKSVVNPQVSTKSSGKVQYIYYDSNNNKLDKNPSVIGKYRLEIISYPDDTYASSKLIIDFSITAKPSIPEKEPATEKEPTPEKQPIPEKKPTTEKKPSTKKTPAKKGTVLKYSNAKYKVTSSNKKSPKVKFVGLISKNKNVVNIPATIKVKGVVYKVTAIADNALKNNKKVTKVNISANITSIGTNAFRNCKKLKNVVIKSKNIKKIGKKAFVGINKKAIIKVPKSKKTKYKKLLKKSGYKRTIKITKK